MPSNCGGNDGSITIIASGNSALSYSINCITYGPSNIFNSLPAGEYTICVRDQNGCIVSQPATITTTDGPVISDIEVEHTSCGEANGEILIIATGGDGDYEYFLNGIPYGNENNITNLPDGIYDIEVRDENGCIATSQVTIDPSVGPDFDVYISAAHCGMSDGSIELDGFGSSIPPYSYSINGAGGPFVLDPFFNNLPNGFYDMAIKDGAGCIYEETVYLVERDAPDIDSVTVTPPGCGLNNGMIVVHASSLFDLEYSIGVPFYQTSPIFSPVAPGTYTITVRDEYGCLSTTTAVILPTLVPVMSINVVNTQCGESTGSLTVNASGGVAPLMYKLNTGSFGLSNVFNGLPAGMYTVTVRGANNCEVSETAVIIGVGEKTSSISDAICLGQTYVFEGTSYTLAGTYSHRIPGGASNGCDSVITLTLSVLPLESITTQVSICPGQIYTHNGIDYDTTGLYVIDTLPSFIGCDTILSINITIVPLETTYLDVSICVSGVFTLNGIDYTTAGEYLLDTIPASVGCDSIRILRLQVEDFNSDSIQVAICDGEIYTLNNIDYSTAGIFVIDTVQGPGGCDTIITLDLTVNPIPSADAGSDQLLDCDVLFVILSGSASGGNPLWTGPGINAGNQNQLTPTVGEPGVYVLSVTSSAGCSDQDTVLVASDPEVVIADAGEDAALSCIVDTIVLQANPTGPQYIYQWTGPGINASNEHLANPVITVIGTYSLVVTDTVNNCVSAPDVVEITDITSNIIAIIQNPNTLDCYSSFIDLNASGSSTGANIIYLWMNEEGETISTSPLVTGISSGGVFMFIVKDTISGCFDDDTVTVQDLQEYPPVDAGLPQQLDCNHETVVLNAGAVNNLPNITFLWTGPAGGILSGSDSISVLVGLGGEYFLEAMDSLTGCSNIDSVMVSDISALPIADIGLIQAFTCTDSVAIIDIGMSDTGPDITYEWNGPLINGVNALILEPTQPGQYNLTVTNQSTGCESVASIILSLPELPDGLDVDVEIPVCAGDTTGSIFVTNVSGGTPAYMYSIDGGPLTENPSFEGLMSGNYSIQVIDANGCSFQEIITVPDGQELTIDIGSDIELDLGDSIILYANVSLPWSQIDSIVWAPDEYLSCTHCINPTLYGLFDGIISATVYTSSCIAQDMLELRVDIDVHVFIPNVFRPNGDNINDVVTVYGDSRVERVVYFEIFDRWGNQVFVGTDFEPNDLQHGWDGIFRGLLMNPAVFAYIARVRLINGDELDFKGDITLVR